jgi:outer membrane protein assembly factor BamB
VGERAWLFAWLFAWLAATATLTLACGAYRVPEVLPCESLVPSPGADVYVTTQHNDRARTGANLAETQLTPDAVDRRVSPGKFRRIFSRRVLGQIYAQPLYVPHLAMADGTTHNVVFVATMMDLVYAFDADDPAEDAPLWIASLGVSLPKDFMPMDEGLFGLNIGGDIGITSTPVIDAAARRLYVSAKVCAQGLSCDGGKGHVVYRVGALDLASGVVAGRLDLDEHNVVSKGGGVALDARRHLQRPGLLLSQGRLYLAFASHQDTPPFHGWLVAVDASTMTVKSAFCTSCTDASRDQIGIWQAGNGPAADDAGFVYVMTGNGTDSDSGGLDASGRPDLGSSFLKFDADLNLVDRFALAGQACLNKQDVDLGSAGPMLLPDTDLVVGGGKEGVIYVLDRQSLGKEQPARPPRPLGGVEVPVLDAPWGQRPCPAQPAEGPPLQAFQAAALWSNQFPGGNIVDWFVTTMSYRHIHGGPVYWNGDRNGPLIYVWPERDRVRAFRYDAPKNRFVDVAPPGREPTATLVGPMSHKYGMPGAALAISANGAKDGILWASLPLEANALTAIVAGRLRALDASTLRPLWDSFEDGHVDFMYAKYAAPTVANGKVYLPTFSNRLDVYGLLR